MLLKYQMDLRKKWKQCYTPADIFSKIVGILWLLSLKIWETQTGISPPIVLAELIHISLEQF